MSDGTDGDIEQVVDDIVTNLSTPESGTVRRDLAVRSPFSDTAHICIETGVPMRLAEEILDEAEERIDLRRRGKVGEAIVDLDNETWELEIEGDST